MRDKLIAIIIGAFFGILAGNLLIKYSPPKTIEIIKEVAVEIQVPTAQEGVIVSLTMADMYEDLSTRYPHISASNKALIMEAIAKISDKHQLNPLIVYSLIAVESSFRWWIEHPLVSVQDSNGKSVKTKAIGLGGIVYEIWGKELVEAKIIESKSDLYSIDKNIYSIGYIYSKLKAMQLHPKANNPIESGLIRYFGGGYRSYFDKIDSNIASMFSNKLYGE